MREHNSGISVYMLSRGAFFALIAQNCNQKINRRIIDTMIRMNKKKKKFLSYILTAALCLSLLAGLSGCGSKNGDTPDPSKPTADPGGKQGQTDVAEPEFVYVPEYVEVKGEFNNSFDTMIYRDGRFLTSVYCKIGEREPLEGEELQYEGQLWIWGNKLFWLSLDGSLEEITGYEPLKYEPEESEPAEGGEPAEAKKALGYNDGGAYMQRMMLAPDGDIVTVEYTYRSWYDGPDDVELYTDEFWEKGYGEYMHNEQHYYLRRLNADGTEKSRILLDELQEEGQDYFYLNALQIDAAGRVYATMDQAIYILDTEGKLIRKISGDNWFEQLLVMGDGTVAAVSWGENGQIMAVIDPESGTLGEPMKVPSNIYNMAQNLAADYDFCYTDGSNLMGYTLADGKQEKILNWVNCDVDNANTGNAFILPDGRILTMESEWDKDYTKCTNRIVILNKVPASSVPQKTKLIFATQYMDYQTRSAIIEFNRKNDEYRIELRDYSEYNTEEDWSAGLTKLTTEIMAGNVPDIIDLNGLPLQKMASRGLLADLYPLLDADPELSRDTIFPSVLRALEQDGHLYRTASGFQINTVVGATSVVGEGPGWTLEQYRRALASMPEGCQPFNEYMTRNDILQQMLSMSMSELIDWDTGKCSFDAPIFRDILEFASGFPEEYVWEEDRVWTEEDDEPNRIAAGKQMLLQAYLDDFTTIQMYNAMFGGEATFIGYPVSEGVGNAMLPNNGGYAISSKCSAPDVAWQFVRKIFTKDYQTQYGWGFPSNRDAFDERLKEAMTPEYEKDANGNYVLDENGEKIEISRGGWGWGSLTVEFHALTQAEADQILDLINSTTRVRDESSEEIMEIILQDTAPYFAGQKSLNDVVKQLQSKMNIYINEQR